MKNENDLEVTGFVGTSFFFKGFVVDTKQREFRKKNHDGTVEIISFDSDQGQYLQPKVYACMLEAFLKDINNLENAVSTLS